MRIRRWRGRFCCVDATFEHECALFSRGVDLVAGVDEVGRGALAGPLVMGAVLIAPQTPQVSGLRDSKLLSAAARERWYEEIPRWCVSWSLGVVGAPEIDEVGMAAALRLGVVRALDGLGGVPGAVIVDGPVDLTDGRCEVVAMLKADQLCGSVAAASVMAKVWRDEQMVKLAETYPAYGFAQHKGYGSRAHRDALAAVGPCEAHRRSFRLPEHVGVP